MCPRKGDPWIVQRSQNASFDSYEVDGQNCIVTTCIWKVLHKIKERKRVVGGMKNCLKGLLYPWIDDIRIKLLLNNRGCLSNLASWCRLPQLRGGGSHWKLSSTSGQSAPKYSGIGNGFKLLSVWSIAKLDFLRAFSAFMTPLVATDGADDAAITPMKHSGE